MITELLKYDAGVLKVLDQQRVTQELKYVEVHHAEDAWTLIRQLHVGSMHLAAIIAALGLAVDVKRHRENFKHASQAEKYLLQKLEYLRTALPSSSYFSGVIDQLRSGVECAAKEELATGKHVIVSFRSAAEKLWSSEMESIEKIGRQGARRLLEQIGKVSLKVLTICNSGALTTAGHGTSLGVVRELHRAGALEHVYACETRPVNQGGKLTLREISAFDVMYKGLPGSLITESAATYLMAARHVDCVVVGADRVAANGDTCNDLGTYSLAISATYHKVPFFSAARTSVLDLASASFARLATHDALLSSVLSTSSPAPALRRHSSASFQPNPDDPPHAAAAAKQQRSSFTATTPDGGRSPPPTKPPSGKPAAAAGRTVITHPLVDVTPSALITGIITEVGVASRRRSHSSALSAASTRGGGRGEEEVIDLPAFLKGSEGGVLPGAVATPAGVPREGYVVLREENIARHVLTLSAVKALLGQNERLVQVQEVGDGNLNFVYVLRAPGGSVVAKQALPYVRCVGESWPLSLERAEFEAAALRLQHEACPFLVPKVLHFDAARALIVMQFVPPPHKILRKCFAAGERVSTFAADVGVFCARTLFFSSGLVLDGSAFRARVAHWSRNTLCALTEQVVFTDPYYPAPLNRHTSPHLDAFVAALRSDALLLRAAAALKRKFLGCAEALVHGDLHTGSVMACEGSTVVIDPEFAFYGPIGFDLGAFVANLLLAYFSTAGHAAAGAGYGAWVLEQVEMFHATFQESFLALWRDAEGSGELRGELFSPGPFPAGSEVLEAAREEYMEDRWRDTVGFAGAEIIRRILGIAHVEDLDEVADPNLRSECEKRCLLLARQMVISSFRGGAVPTLPDLLDEARRLYSAPMATATWPAPSP